MRSVAAMAVLCVATAPSPSLGYERPTSSERTDLSLGGKHPDSGYAQTSSLSADGRYVAFDSDSAELVERDVNLMSDVFVRDFKTNKIELVSRAQNGEPALPSAGTLFNVPGGFWLASSDLSFDPQISPNGRFVVFTSSAANIVSGDTNLMPDIFITDRRLGTVERISVSNDEKEARGSSFLPSISGDGRYVSFTSDAPNLIDNDTNDMVDVFVRDRKRGETSRASVASGGNESTQECVSCLSSLMPSSLSSDGKVVAFSTGRTDLVEGDTNNLSDVFVHDLRDRTTERVSLASDGSQASDPLTAKEGSTLTPFAGAGLRSLSADGRFVVFGSTSSDLVPNDANGSPSFGGHPGEDIFVHDRRTGRTERVSVESDGSEVNTANNAATYNFIWSPAISPDGRHVVYVCDCRPSALGPSLPQGGETRAVIADRHTGAVVTLPRVRLDSSVHGEQDAVTHIWPDISKNGRFVSVAGAIDRAPGVWDAGIFRLDVGEELGTTVAGRDPSLSTGRATQAGSLCIATRCLSPSGVVAINEMAAGMNGQSNATADLVAAKIAYRPALGDLLITLEIDSMPTTPTLAGATAGIVYGVNLEIAGRNYELRGASVGLGLRGETRAYFGLFDCSSRLTCTEAHLLHGGFGTTGSRITFSVPLSSLELDVHDEISRVEAFTAAGSPLGRLNHVLDRLVLE